MKKTLYSLMLNEEVVREVDALAHRTGTNRSNLINQILAEYVDYTTPERRINDIFTAMERLMSPQRDLVPFFAPNTFSMSLKSSLQYKYRPTVKYEVELYRCGEGSIGKGHLRPLRGEAGEKHRRPGPGRHRPGAGGGHQRIHPAL